MSDNLDLRADQQVSDLQRQLRKAEALLREIHPRITENRLAEWLKDRDALLGEQSGAAQAETSPHLATVVDGVMARVQELLLVRPLPEKELQVLRQALCDACLNHPPVNLAEWTAVLMDVLKDHRRMLDATVSDTWWAMRRIQRYLIESIPGIE